MVPPLAPKWPVAFSAAVTMLRQTLRQVPSPVLSSSATVQTLLQPVANSLRWPELVLQSGVKIQPDTVGGVPGEWLLPESFTHAPTAGTDRLLLWAHGGGFAFLSPGTHRLFLSRVAARAGLPVFCVDYRKPPEFPFPAPGHDVLSVYKSLRGKKAADKLFIGGDSAGGNLAIEVARTLCSNSKSSYSSGQPAGVVLLSPWVDLSDTSTGSWKEYIDTDFLPSSQADVVARLYASNRALEDYQISPGLRKEWPTTFPSVLLDYGSSEVLRTQVEGLAENLGNSGVKVDAFASEGMVHCYPLFEFLWGESAAKEDSPFEAYFKRVVQFLQR
eukprot:TRINITY_DN17103_c0_g1_i1.p1 TRINITY_DN17103_c0_g1~~TRINITY_DN17103_c0_g1_i1.p1  ORF type:complete len:330 (+),score=36.57 TRINITY_DN17103_c0_g1_i1:165-1154(+)